MYSPACILSLIGTAVMRGEMEEVWRWSDDPELSAEKTAQESSVASRALPDVQNGNSTPQPSNGADVCDQADAEVTEGDEEGTDGMRRKKRTKRGKKT